LLSGIFFPLIQFVLFEQKDILFSRYVNIIFFLEDKNMGTLFWIKKARFKRDFLLENYNMLYLSQTNHD